MVLSPQDPIAFWDIFFPLISSIVFHTYGWDLIIANEYAIYADEIVLCSDRGSEVPLHGFISARSYRLLGYIFPPYFVYGYNDIWLGEIYKSLGRHKVLMNLEVEHRHWHTSPWLIDETYARVLSPDKTKNVAEEKDRGIYEAKQWELQKAIQVLRDAIRSPANAKK